MLGLGVLGVFVLGALSYKLIPWAYHNFGGSWFYALFRYLPIWGLAVIVVSITYWILRRDKKQIAKNEKTS